MKTKRICIIFPEVNPIANIILSQYVSLLLPFSQRLWILTKNDVFEYDESGKLEFVSGPNCEFTSMIRKIPLFINMDITTTIKFFKIRKEIDIIVINHTRGTYLLPQVIAKLLGKKIILITGGTPSECICLQPF